MKFTDITSVERILSKIDYNKKVQLEKQRLKSIDKPNNRPTTEIKSVYNSSFSRMINKERIDKLKFYYPEFHLNVKDKAVNFLDNKLTENERSNIIKT